MPNGNEPGKAIDALELSGQLQDAAQAAEAAGLHERAAGLYERACVFDLAARSALRAGQLQRAMLLASMSADPQLLECATSELLRDPELAKSTALLLVSRGQLLIGARLLESSGELRGAAEAYAQAGDGLAAAQAFEASGDLRAAARVLEAALRSSADSEPVMLALGMLLIRASRPEPALRVLQRIGQSSPLYEQVLPVLSGCLDALGLTGPRDALVQQARQLGFAQQPPPACSPAAPPHPDHNVMYGRYEIVRQAASTPAARVFEATDRLSGRRVALKQLLSASLVGAGRDGFERLVREARALQRLRHPNVVPLVELMEEAAVIVTPWMAGGSLADLMASQRVVPARAVEIACAVLAALAEAHRLGILHRDVKPSNILFDESGTPLLADFGAAHLSDSSATATAGVIGTLGYMSPEQRYGRPATGASDLYSVGATLLEMLAGCVPGGSSNVPPPSAINPDLGPEHDQVVLALLDEDPLKRPASALAARDALRGLKWPASLSSSAQNRTVTPAAEPRTSGRLARGPDGAGQDGWLERRVIVVAADELHLRAAQAYATAPSDVLSAVLRVDADAQEIWFEAPELAVSGAQTLNAAHRDRIAKALEHLHSCGVAHGSIDAMHVRVVGPWAQLVFEPRTVATAAPQSDREAFERLPQT